MASRAQVSEDKRWAAQDALRTLQRAQEITKDKTLMAAVKREADMQTKAIAAVVKTGSIGRTTSKR